MKRLAPTSRPKHSPTALIAIEKLEPDPIGGALVEADLLQSGADGIEEIEQLLMASEFEVVEECVVENGPRQIFI